MRVSLNLPDQGNPHYCAHLLVHLLLGADKGFQCEAVLGRFILIIEEVSRQASHGHQDQELLGRYPEERRGQRHMRPDLFLF